MSRRRRGLVLLGGVALGLSACGGGAAALTAGSDDAGRQVTVSASKAVSVKAPKPPRGPVGYKPPEGAAVVRDAAELKDALRRGRQSFIVLEPGRYESTVPFLNPGGNRLYARKPGKSVLTAGISMGGNSGPGRGVLRGLTFDVRSPSRTADEAIISVWGTGRDTRLQDLTLRGHGVVGSGILARQPSGLNIARVRASGFRNYGVLADANEPGSGVLARPANIRDVRISDVHRSSPGSSDGRAEACLWVGNTAFVSRARLSDCAVTGLWTGTAMRNARVSDVQVSGSPVGIYLEHTTRSSRFTGLSVTPSVEIGMVAEWADPRSGGPASIDNVISHSTFKSSLVGVYLDAGTRRTTIRDSRFSGQSWGAIGDYRGDHNAYFDNDYRGIDSGAQAVRRDALDRGN